MSIEVLQNRVQSYESLFDKLLAASDSERSALLSTYAHNRRSNASKDTLSSSSNHKSSTAHTNGDTERLAQLKASMGGDPNATLAVLGCGTFNLCRRFGLHG